MSVGVFGGTFNPIHLGHLHIACSVQQLFGLSRIYLVVASTPPHKPGLDLAPFLDRYAMVSVALSGSDRLIPSAIELERPASPFSIDTMKKFARRSKSGHDGLYFIAGGDSLYRRRRLAPRGGTAGILQFRVRDAPRSRRERSAERRPRQDCRQGAGPARIWGAQHPPRGGRDGKTGQGNFCRGCLRPGHFGLPGAQPGARTAAA